MGAKLFRQESIEAGARMFMADHNDLYDTLDMHVDSRTGFYSAEALCMTLKMHGLQSLRAART
eukprot:5508433-Amphidinium_carterae.1